MRLVGGGTVLVKLVRLSKTMTVTRELGPATPFLTSPACNVTSPSSVLLLASFVFNSLQFYHLKLKLRQLTINALKKLKIDKKFQS